MTFPLHSSIVRFAIPALAFASLVASVPAQPASTSTAPTTAPTTRPVTNADLAGTAVIELWPAGALKDQPATNTEEVQERTDNATNRRDRRATKISHPRLVRFPPAEAGTALPAVVVIPGGGYGGVVFDREGYFVADYLRKKGIATFVLFYRLPVGIAPGANEMPVPIQDVQRAVRMLRANAATYHIDPARIGVMGFSAGGHVAGTAATQFDAGNAAASDPIDRASSRPDFAVLVYPVASMDESIAHAGSRKALLGANPDQTLEDRFSTAKRITPQTPPLMVLHAKDDRVVKIANSDEIAEAAKRAGVACDYIVYNTGGHGFGMARPDTEPAGWLDRFLTWLQTVPKT